MTESDIDAVKRAINALEPSRITARLREHMPLIEARRRDGVSYEQIADIFRADGFEVKEATLKKYVARYRKKAGIRFNKPKRAA